MQKTKKYFIILLQSVTVNRACFNMERNILSERGGTFVKKRVSQSNVQVRIDMYKALLRLMRAKAFSSISVSDLTLEAGVSRMSFYRNYNAIEDILTEHLVEVVEEYKAEEFDEPGAESEKIFYKKEYMLRCFHFFYLHREFIDALITAGMGDLFLAKITEYLIRKWTNIEKRTREESLRISAFAGAIYNTYREWSKEDFLEKPERVAAVLYDFRKI